MAALGVEADREGCRGDGGDDDDERESGDEDRRGFVSCDELAESIEGPIVTGRDGSAVENGGKIVAEGLDALVTLSGVFVQGFEEDGVEVTADPRIERSGTAWGVVDDSMEDVDERAATLEGELARQALEENDREGIDIGACIGGACEDLFRRGVPRRADEGSVGGEGVVA